jgi:hypothetical protein
VTSGHSLAEREAIKLRRLQHIVARLVNVRLCRDCTPWLDELIEEEIQYVQNVRRKGEPKQTVARKRAH